MRQLRRNRGYWATIKNIRSCSERLWQENRRIDNGFIYKINAKRKSPLKKCMKSYYRLRYYVRKGQNYG